MGIDCDSAVLWHSVHLTVMYDLKRTLIFEFAAYAS